MPEMNEFVDDALNKRNYLTQDEMGDPRLGAPGKNKRRKNRAESEDEDLAGAKGKHFTPGRIRASRMGQSNMDEYGPGKQHIMNNPRARTQ